MTCRQNGHRDVSRLQHSPHTTCPQLSAKESFSVDRQIGHVPRTFSTLAEVGFAAPHLRHCGFEPKMRTSQVGRIQSFAFRWDDAPRAMLHFEQWVLLPKILKLQFGQYQSEEAMMLE